MDVQEGSIYAYREALVKNSGPIDYSHFDRFLYRGHGFFIRYQLLPVTYKGKMFKEFEILSWCHPVDLEKLRYIDEPKPPLSSEISQELAELLWPTESKESIFKHICCYQKVTHV